MATPNGLEPSTSSVTGWRANRLHHRATFAVAVPQQRDVLYTTLPCLSTPFFAFFEKSFRSVIGMDEVLLTQYEVSFGHEVASQ